MSKAFLISGGQFILSTAEDVYNPSVTSRTVSEVKGWVSNVVPGVYRLIDEQLCKIVPAMPPSFLQSKDNSAALKALDPK